MHHWADPIAGLREMRRVASGVVVLTWDPASPGFWIADYVPEILEIDRRIFLPIDAYRDVFGEVEVVPLPIPHDCTDGFLGAYWRRPAAYLDDVVRTAISTFARTPEARARLEALARDLASGAWAGRHASLVCRASLDVGYRLVIAPGASPREPARQHTRGLVAQTPAPGD